MLASFIITLQVNDDVALPGLGGEALHGLVFETLRAYDPTFAEPLHDAAGARPFSLSGVLGRFAKRQGKVHIPANADVEFRLSLLHDDVIEYTLAAFGRLTAGTSVRLGAATARFMSITFQLDTHPLVQATTYPMLLQRAATTPRLTVRFLSPTSFRAGNAQDVLPRPERVFGSLYAAWQAFAPAPLDDTLVEVFPTLRISAYDLRTELVHFGRYKVIGFKGQVTYTCPGETDAQTRRALNALADFAFYAGVGYKTTMGLGQARHLQRGT